MEPKTRCIRCGAEILVQTSRRNGGFCQPCAKRRRYEHALNIPLKADAIEKLVSGDRNPCFSTHDEPLAVFPYCHPKVGNLAIRVEGEEARLDVGTIAHGHRGPPDFEQADPDNVMGVCSDVIEFLDHLFADRVVFYFSS
jgi:hypothetical protein